MADVELSAHELGVVITALGDLITTYGRALPKVHNRESLEADIAVAFKLQERLFPIKGNADEPLEDVDQDALEQALNIYVRSQP